MVGHQPVQAGGGFVPGGWSDQKSSLCGSSASSWQRRGDGRMSRGVEPCWCLKVVVFFEDFSALTHWLCRRFWQKAAGLLSQTVWLLVSSALMFLTSQT